MGKDRKQKNPPPDNSIYDEREPEQEPTNYPGSGGEHQPDIQDEKSKRKRSNIPIQKRDDINPEEVPGIGNPEEYNDGEPVEEKSPRAKL